MFRDDSTPSCCQNPDRLRGPASDCSKEQIAQCHGTSERHPCTCHTEGVSNEKRLYTSFIFIVVCAPILFLFYWKNDWVCAPRAITASAIFGIVPLIFLTTGLLKEIGIFYYLALFALAGEIVITPVIMLRKLGWEKLIGERLPAFFTFEGIAIVEIAIVLLLFRIFWKKVRTTS
jgi:hypothetical protein